MMALKLAGLGLLAALALASAVSAQTLGPNGTAKGVVDGSAAPAGIVGEFVCAQVTNGGSPAGCASNISTAVSLTTSTAANCTSASLTAGDWEVWVSLQYFPAGTTTITYVDASISTTSATEPTAPGGGAFVSLPGPSAAGQATYVFGGQARVSLAAPTTVFAVAKSGFGVSTMSVGCFLGARRVR